MRAIYKLSVFLLIMGAITGVGTTYAQDSQLLVPVAQTRSIQSDPNIPQSKAVRFNPAMLTQRSAAKLTIELFDGEEITIEHTTIKASTLGSNGWIMTGRVRGYPLSEVVFTWQGSVAAATINLGQQDVFRLRHAKNGVHLFERLPLSYLPTSEPDVPDVPTENEENDDHGANKGQRSESAGLPDALHDNHVASEQPPTIDVLVLYTGSAEEALGGADGTENTIALAFEESNLGFANSQVHAQFNVVYRHKVDFDEAPHNFSDMLGALTTKADGVLDDIHTLRDLYGADVVTMIVDRPLLCGKTYQNTGRYSNFDRYAFVILHHSCVTGYYSFSHEIGHVMGSQHDRQNAAPAGIFDYSYGYQDPSHQFRTIMAYNCDVNCPRINHWSNPNVKFEDKGATGVHSESAHSAHNSLSLSRMAPVIASYRHRVLPENLTVKVNFQADTADSFEGYLADYGLAVDSQGEQLVYGWRGNLAGLEFNAAADSPATSYVHAVGAQGAPAEWELLVPTGNYHVRVVSGGARDGRDSASIVVEGNLLENSQLSAAMENAASAILDEQTTVSVTDGFLTIRGTKDETTLNLVEITPLITDPDGDLHVNPQPSQSYKNTIFLPLVVR